MSRHDSVRIVLLASAALLAATPAFAQDSEAAGQTAEAPQQQQEGEIIVTARRRAESLIDVPIAVTAISGAQLNAQGALDITDIAQSAPNVSLEVSRGTNNTLSAFIRGVGQQDPVAGFEAGVGLYLDDVYLNRPQAAVLDIYDVERIEVLRGPQGTLYGRNTIGGAVKYVTKRIGADPTLQLRGSYGSYNQADLVVSASAPIGDTGLKIGAAGARLSRGGFGTNRTTGLDNYNKDLWAARGTVEYEPSSSAFFRVSGDYTHDKSNSRGGHRLIPGIVSGTPVLADVFDSQGGLVNPRQDVKAWGVTGLAELRPADWLTFRSITAYRKDDSATPIDFDALPAVQVDVPAFYNNKQFSQEAQLLVNTGGLSGLLGVYYLDAKARTVFDVRLPGGVTALTFGDVNTDTVAVFGDFTYDLTPMFSISAGGRYTWDQRQSRVLRQTYLGGGSPYFGGAGVLAATTSDFRGSADFKKFTPRASVSFKPSKDHTLYASWSKGFKGGGFDPRGQTSACRTPSGATCTPAQVYDFMSFDPETVSSYELGYKAALFDRRLTFALAAFHADYTDVQVPGSIGTTINGQQTFIGITTNAGKARMRGVEFEGNLIAARDLGTRGGTLNLNWSVGYLDARYLRFIDSRGIDVASRRRIQNTPDWTASGTIGYSVPVGSDGQVAASFTASYRSASQQFELRTPVLDQPGFTLFDANVNWDINKMFSIGVHGRNLFDKRYIVSGYNFLAQNPDTGDFLRTPAGAYVPTLGTEGVLTGYYGNPRQVFVTGTVKF
ncbi:iron complex outermembrane recepter protein [Sphingomonas sp. NFR04]|uniref:TonB-dependent receptor n=1 Tax=Sphingomonas sp. NFR04 TaxID=1566283 RepID=UPI0008DF5092|nr:TonB-dependent receptor [Sphingomonas sp. NFR04]SFJ78498.1 iron complex outermembrane recepter protein [Sphingomonas sp. NFR04]